jgi:hypothetical protein
LHFKTFSRSAFAPLTSARPTGGATHPLPAFDQSRGSSGLCSITIGRLAVMSDAALDSSLCNAAATARAASGKGCNAFTNVEVVGADQDRCRPNFCPLDECAEQLAYQLKVGCDRALTCDCGLHITKLRSQLGMRLEPCTLRYQLCEQSFALRCLQGLQIDRAGLLGRQYAPTEAWGLYLPPET